MNDDSPTAVRRGLALLIVLVVTLGVAAGGVLWKVFAQIRNDGAPPTPVVTPTVTEPAERTPGLPAGALPPNTRKPSGPALPPRDR